MEIRKFWADCKATAARLERDVLEGRLPHQPEPVTTVNTYGETIQRVEALFVTSLKNDFHGTTAGQIALGTLALISQRLVEKSHRLSTPEEIAKYHADNARRLVEAQQEDSRRGNGTASKFVITMPAEPVAQV